MKTMEVKKAVCLLEIKSDLDAMIETAHCTGAGIIALVSAIGFLDEYYKTHEGYNDMMVDLVDDEEDVLYMAVFVSARMKKAMEEIRREKENDKNSN